MIEIESHDGNFIVRPADRTITKDEIPRIMLDASKILFETVMLYRAVASGDTLAAGRAIVDIYNALLDIKKMVED